MISGISVGQCLPGKNEILVNQPGNVNTPADSDWESSLHKQLSDGAGWKALRPVLEQMINVRSRLTWTFVTMYYYVYNKYDTSM